MFVSISDPSPSPFPLSNPTHREHRAELMPCFFLAASPTLFQKIFLLRVTILLHQTRNNWKG